MARFSVRRAAVVGVAVAAVVAASGTVRAEAPQRGRGAPPAPTNLQVFPSDMPAQQLFPIMQAFTAALGVDCAHCHVFVGPGDPMNDFAADTKPQKDIARAMVRMVREINPQVAKAVAPKAADQVAQVGCAVCHRGAAIPEVAAGSPGAPPPPRGRGAGGNQ